MLWRKTTATHYFEYVAVTRLERVRVDKELYGQRHYKVYLFDGTVEEITFEADEWRQWEASFTKGGLVINA